MIENFYQNPDLLIVIHFISTSLMVGVIWIIQLLHYPSFHFIDKANYALQMMAEGKLSLGINNKNLEMEQMKLKNFRNNILISFFGIIIVFLLVF